MVLLSERLIAAAQELLERWGKSKRRLDALQAEEALIRKQEPLVARKLADIRERISQGVAPEETASYLSQLDAAHEAAERLGAYSQSVLRELAEIKEEMQRTRAEREALEAEGDRYFEL
jgi:predicted  nucleic acid-binding Zn-ribbon protein